MPGRVLGDLDRRQGSFHSSGRLDMGISSVLRGGSIIGRLGRGVERGIQINHTFSNKASQTNEREIQNKEGSIHCFHSSVYVHNIVWHIPPFTDGPYLMTSQNNYSHIQKHSAQRTVPVMAKECSVTAPVQSLCDVSLSSL